MVEEQQKLERPGEHALKVVQASFARWLTTHGALMWFVPNIVAALNSLKISRDAAYEGVDPGQVPAELAMGKEDEGASFLYKQMATYCFHFWMHAMSTLMGNFDVLSLRSQRKDEDFTQQLEDIPTAIANIEKLGDSCDVIFNLADESAADAAAAGHPGALKASHPPRTRAVLENKLKTVCASVAAKLEPLTEVLQWQSSLQKVLQERTWPAEVKDPDASDATLNAYFDEHIAVLEAEFGGGRIWQEGQLQLAFRYHRKRIIAEVLVQKKIHLAAEETRIAKAERRQRRRNGGRHGRRRRATAAGAAATKEAPRYGLGECSRAVITSFEGEDDVLVALACIALVSGSTAVQSERIASLFDMYKPASRASSKRWLVETQIFIKANGREWGCTQWWQGIIVKMWVLIVSQRSTAKTQGFQHRIHVNNTDFPSFEDTFGR